MIELSFAAILGFKVGACFERGSMLLSGLIGSIASATSFTLGNDMLQNYSHLLPRVITSMF